MTTQNKLAEALRSILSLMDFAATDDRALHGDNAEEWDSIAPAARAALAEHDAQPAPACPHCARTLEGAELARGLCGSDDCPRHDAAKALRGLVRATYHMTDTIAATGDAFQVAHGAAREALALYPDLPA